jgi:hypothetical protein
MLKDSANTQTLVSSAGVRHTDSATEVAQQLVEAGGSAAQQRGGGCVQAVEGTCSRRAVEWHTARSAAAAEAAAAAAAAAAATEAAQRVRDKGQRAPTALHVPQASERVGARGDEVGGVHRPHAVPHPPAAPQPRTRTHCDVGWGALRARRHAPSLS